MGSFGPGFLLDARTNCFIQNVYDNLVSRGENTMQWLSDNLPLIFGVLFGVSESLALIPSVKSNSIFQLIFNVISTLAGKGKQS
jgi:hypothetical protein